MLFRSSPHPNRALHGNDIVTARTRCPGRGSWCGAGPWPAAAAAGESEAPRTQGVEFSAYISKQVRRVGHSS